MNSRVGNQPNHLVRRERSNHSEPSALRPAIRKPKRPCSLMRLVVRRVAEDVGLIFIIYLYSSRFRAKLKCGNCCRSAAAARQLPTITLCLKRSFGVIWPRAVPPLLHPELVAEELLKFLESLLLLLGDLRDWLKLEWEFYAIFIHAYIVAGFVPTSPCHGCRCLRHRGSNPIRPKGRHSHVHAQAVEAVVGCCLYLYPYPIVAGSVPS